MFGLGKATLLSASRRLTQPRRLYSDAVPLHKLHHEVQDIEGLFQKYKLNELNSKEKIDELVRSGAITEHIGKELNHDLKVQQEAGSTKTNVDSLFKLNMCRDCGVLEKGILVHRTSDYRACRCQHLLPGDEAL